MNSLLIATACFTASISPMDTKIVNEKIWKLIENGDYSLAHKMIISKNSSTKDEMIMDSVMHAYAKREEGIDVDDHEILDTVENILNYKDED